MGYREGGGASLHRHSRAGGNPEQFRRGVPSTLDPRLREDDEGASIAVGALSRRRNAPPMWADGGEKGQEPDSYPERRRGGFKAMEAVHFGRDSMHHTLLIS